MEGEKAATSTGWNPPAVREVTLGDIAASLKEGWRDFTRAPLFGLFFGAVYAAGGILILFMLAKFGMAYMVIPLIVGFILIGPFVAVGLYEVSRALEQGRPLVWRDVLGVIAKQRTRGFGSMAFLTLFVMWIWLYQIRLLLALVFGLRAGATLEAFLIQVFTTSNGLVFLAVGTLTGAVLALILFAVTVVSFPLLLDRDVDFITAVITSLRTIAVSPGPMIGWGLAVALLAVLAMVPAFLGLLVVLPVLGHATWHLYRRAVVPAESSTATRTVPAS